MRLLLFAGVDMSKTDACVVHVLDLAKAFKQIGVEVDIVVISPQSSVVTEPNLKVHVLPKWGRFWIIRGLLSSLWLWIISFLKCCRKTYDVIYIRYHPNLAPALRLLPTRLPIWLEINNIFNAEEIFYKKRIGAGLQRWLALRLDRLAYKAAHKLICVTPQIAEHLACTYSVPTEKITVVSNGVDIDQYHPLNKTHCRRQLGLGLEENLFYFGFIGNFAGWQGVEVLLESLPPLMKKYQNIRALIVGDGAYFNDYTTLVKKLGITNKVIFPGRVHKDVAPVWINSFDVGVALTLKRPIASGYSPLKLYSYMACGVPVVATDTAGFEPVREYQTGILVKPENRIELQSALERLIVDKELCLTAGRQGRQCAENLFSWKRVAQKIINSS